MKNRQDHMQSSCVLQYPRKKLLLWNLSQLLNHKTIDSPQTVLTQRMFPQNQNRQIQKRQLTTSQSHKTITHEPSKNYKILTSSFRKTTINFQHYRTKSSLRNKYNFMSQTKQSKKHARQQITKKHYNLDKEQQKRSPSIQGIGLQKTLRSSQLFNKNQALKNHNYAFRQQIYAASSDRLCYDYQSASVARSLQIGQSHTSSSTVTVRESQEQFQKSQSLQQQFNQNTKKAFLKKGSSLQKQIVVNLLKNKMLKQHQSNLKKEYNKNQILNMIKLFKGFQQHQVINPQISPIKSRVKKQTVLYEQIKKKKLKKQQIILMKSCPLQIVEKFHKPLNGWEIENQVQLEVYNKDQGNHEATMDDSHQPV